MKFYDREEEIEILGRNRKISERTGTFTVITGRRRVGKTELIKEAEKESRVLYHFVQKNSESMVCEQLIRDAKESLGIDLIRTDRFDDLFRQLMIYGKDNAFTFVLDEFQELERINKAIISGIQNHWDSYKKRSKVNLIACGSVYSMMIQIFQNSKEPLFGRASSNMNIHPFPPSVIKKILKDHNPDHTSEDLLLLYMVSGGVPKYIELLMDSGAVSFDDMIRHICSKDSLFLKEGKDLLTMEFGNEYGTYHSVLRLISEGRNTAREISDSLKKEAGQYLDNLEKKYLLVKKSRPVFSGDGSRNIRWKISDRYIDFYFRFISCNMSLIELKKFDILEEKIRKGYHGYSGRVLEEYFREKIAEEERITHIGQYWDRKGMNEIDIIALNDVDMKAIVADVKRDKRKIDISELRRKAGTAAELNEFDIEFRGYSIDDM